MSVTLVASCDFVPSLHVPGRWYEAHTACHWAPAMFLRCWVPELSDAPAESSKKKDFLAWLGVEQRLHHPELVVLRLKSHSLYLHRFLQDLPEDPLGL